MSVDPDADRDASSSGLPPSSSLSSSAIETATDWHASEQPTQAELIIPVLEETARIDKRVVEKGRVRVSTHTDTVEQILRESLQVNAVGVTRVPIDRVIAEGEAPPITRIENGVTIIPVLEEVLVVEKRLVLKEEVHIRQTVSEEAVEVPVTLRRQHAVVERVSADGHVSEIPKEEKAP